MEKNSIEINEKSENNKNNKIREIGNKLKESIKIFFAQLKFGCQRKFCYNPYCEKSLCVNIKGGDKDIISECIKLAKLNSCEQFFCKDHIEKEKIKTNNNVDTNNFLVMSNVEQFIFAFDKDPNYLEQNFNSNNLVKINIDFLKLKNYYETHKENDIELDLININKYFTLMLSLNIEQELKLDDKYYSRLYYYLYHVYSKVLIYLSFNPNFCFLETLTSEFLTFFDTFKILKSKIKFFSNLPLSIISPFEEFTSNKNDYMSIINNYQNFLALMLFQIGEGQEDEFRDEKSFEVLVKFMKVLKLFYQINEKYNLISYKDFYNDSVSKYLNLKEECKTYAKILNNKNKPKKNNKDNDEEEEKPFSLIKYHWLFDAAAKSDILYIFNYHKQRTEMMNSINDIMNLQANLVDMRGMFLYIEVRRNNLIEDTLNFISNPQLNFRKQLKIKFTGEQGIDEGGVKKEFFLLLIRQLFDPDYGMFTFNNKNRFFWFNSMSFESKIKFELIGVILGLAFFNNVILDIKFPLVIYKKLLGLETSIDDLKEIDLELYNNLKFLLTTQEKNLKEKLGTTFTVIVDQFGEKISVPLKEDGENIFIDENNREEYVALYLDWFFNKSIEHVYVPFRNGFYRVCENKLFHMLRPEEIELIICGTQTLDFFELEKSTRYDDGYDKDSITIKNFWEVVHSLPEQDQKKFLFFLTGCDRAPINGLGSMIITITRFGPDSDKLPCAHTCFNHLLLPEYGNKEKLRERLVIAINNSEGFGLM